MFCVRLKRCSNHVGSQNSRKMILMIPSDEQPDRSTNERELSFSAVEEQDALVQSFRDFLHSELSRRGQNHLAEVVAEFSRRVDFLTGHVAADLDTGDVASMILELTDAKMAELALDAVDSNGGRDRLARYLQARPYPHYEADPNNANLLIRIERDGTRTSGRFVDQEFVAVNNG